MSEGWRKMAAKLMREQSLSMKDLSLRIGRNQSTVQTWFTPKKGSGKRSAPSIDNFIAMANELGVLPSELLHGEGRIVATIPIVGVVAAGEGWTPVDDAKVDPIEFDIGSRDTIGLEVRGESMEPVYRSGDFLICHRHFGPNPDNLIGLDCVVRTKDGDNYVKILKRGTKPGRFNLKSYNPVADDIENVAIAWVAPVAWIKRSPRR